MSIYNKINSISFKITIEHKYGGFIYAAILKKKKP